MGAPSGLEFSHALTLSIPMLLSSSSCCSACFLEQFYTFLVPGRLEVVVAGETAPDHGHNHEEDVGHDGLVERHRVAVGHKVPLVLELHPIIVGHPDAVRAVEVERQDGQEEERRDDLAPHHALEDHGRPPP